MISDINKVLEAISTLLGSSFKSVFTETKTKISTNEFPAVILTVGEGTVQMQYEGQSNIDVSLQIDILDSDREIQKVLINHTDTLIKALNPFVAIDDTDAKAFPQGFDFSFDEEDSRIGTASITYNISI